MKILVTGASGFLGSNIMLRRGHEFLGTFLGSGHTGLERLDISRREEVAEFIKKSGPDAVIHTAAMRNDAAEKDHEGGYRINVEGSRNVARACKETGAFMVHVSTDLIFDGNRGNYIEADPPSPVSYYGETKAAAEREVREALPLACIARTSLVFGWDSRRGNFTTTVIKNLKEGKPFEVVSDQHVTPSYVSNVAEMLVEMCERRLDGIFNVAGATRLTRYEFALEIADVFSLDRRLLKPVSMDQVNWGTKRGRDCSLDVSLITKTLKTKPMSSLQGLMAMKNAGGN
jgi:dTDP-4-dehydrorhamnose reductase